MPPAQASQLTEVYSLLSTLREELRTSDSLDMRAWLASWGSAKERVTSLKRQVSNLKSEVEPQEHSKVGPREHHEHQQLTQTRHTAARNTPHTETRTRHLRLASVATPSRLRQVGGRKKPHGAVYDSSTVVSERDSTRKQLRLKASKRLQELEAYKALIENTTLLETRQHTTAKPHLPVTPPLTPSQVRTPVGPAKDDSTPVKEGEVRAADPPVDPSQLDHELDTLPSSPRWTHVGFSNLDCQPDSAWATEKQRKFKKSLRGLINTLSTCMTETSDGESYVTMSELEWLVKDKRAKSAKIIQAA